MIEAFAGRNPPPIQTVRWKRLATFGLVTLGMFMAMLDIQIVASSLTQIQAGLAASADEIVWVQTSYLIAETVMIPLSSFLTRALSFRVAVSLSCAGFTIASILCACASNIGEMILFRTLQGFIGGVMVPSVYGAAYKVFGHKEMAKGSTIMALILTLAPMAGPTLGGWLTDTFSWHWLFLINIVPGIIVTMGIWSIGQLDQPDIKLLGKMDIAGLVLMALFLGSLSYVLEEGARQSWFDDDTIRLWSFVTVISGVGLFWRLAVAEEPLIRLETFRDFNFTAGTLLSSMAGAAMYGTIFLNPLFLARVGQLSSSQIGNILFVSGAVMLLMGPLSGWLAKNKDARVLISIGFVLVAISSWMCYEMTVDWRFNEMFWPQVWRSAGLMLVLPAIMTTAFVTLPPHLSTDGAALMPLIRNLGGAFGIAIFNTMLLTRSNLHWTRLADEINPARDVVVERLTMLKSLAIEQGLPDPDASVLRQIGQEVGRQALAMGFADCFFALAVMMIVIACVPWLLSRSPKAA